MAPPPLPVVGSPAQYVAAGQPPCAAIIVNVSRADEVSVVFWLNTGTQKVMQNTAYVLPGKTPPPNADYVIPLPGGPTAAPAGP